jgi:hypothetical protein
MLSWKKLHLEQLLLPRHVSAVLPLKSMQRPHLHLWSFSTLSCLSHCSLFFTTVHICQTAHCTHCFSVQVHTHCYYPGGKSLAALVRQSLKERLAPTKQVPPIGHFAPHHCPQKSRPSHLLQSSFQKFLFVVRFLVGSVFYL